MALGKEVSKRGIVPRCGFDPTQCRAGKLFARIFAKSFEMIFRAVRSYVAENLAQAVARVGVKAATSGFHVATSSDGATAHSAACQMFVTCAG